MKVLPRKIDIDKAKAQERKREIDAGLELAKRVDTLRELRIDEEKNLNEWRDNALKTVQAEIDALIVVKDNLIRENQKATVLRQELLKPLDAEWAEINQEKAKNKEELDKNIILKFDLDGEYRKLNIEREQAAKIITDNKEKDRRATKNLKEISSLKELAQNEYEIARYERETQNEEYERKQKELAQFQEEYENGVTINKLTAKSLKEKEAELIIREKDLIRRQDRLVLVEKIKNGIS